MCRLFGFRSNVESRAHRSLISAENAVAEQAQQHADGWGIGYFVGKDAYLFRSSEGAATDDTFRNFGERLQSQTFLVHLRRATVGKIDTINSHPFRYGSWMFAHNGTFFGFTKLRKLMLEDILPEYRKVIFGTTDSEHYFFFLLSEMVRSGCSVDGRGEGQIEVMAQAQQRALSKLFTWAKEFNLEPPKANYILTNGKLLFARRAGLELYMATQKTFCPEIDICKEEDKVCLAGILPSIVPQSKQIRKCNHLLVASEPIGEHDIWEEIPDGFLLSLDENFLVRLHKRPNPFWVTWPEEVSKHPERKNVIRSSIL
jgi:predicted glutamine amidotransferase